MDHVSLKAWVPKDVPGRILTCPGCQGDIWTDLPAQSLFQMPDHGNASGEVCPVVGRTYRIQGSTKASYAQELQRSSSRYFKFRNKKLFEIQAKKEASKRSLKDKRRVIRNGKTRAWDRKGHHRVVVIPNKFGSTCLPITPVKNTGGGISGTALRWMYLREVGRPGDNKQVHAYVKLRQTIRRALKGPRKKDRQSKPR